MEVTIEILSGARFSFEAPQGEGYRDEGDYHVGEIYQGYSYCTETGAYVADLYFGIATELDCNDSPENIRRAYERYHGAATEFSVAEAGHPVFERRAEFRNAGMRRIVYWRRIDEFELFAGELLLKTDLAEKELQEKLLDDFERMVRSCKAQPEE